MNILVVDDEKEIADVIELYLQNDQYSVFKYYTGQEALDCIRDKKIELAILDVMLPDIDGFQILKKIREKYTFPVIMLTAKTEYMDKITGLTMGADDYIVKPFDISEVLARVEMVLRRYGKGSAKLTFKDIVIDPNTREVRKGEKIVSLTPKEYELFLFLVQNKNQLLFREDLFEEVWQTEYVGNSRTLDLHIQRLRKKLDLKEEIKTVFRMGYKLLGE